MLAHIVPLPGNHDIFLWPASALLAAGCFAAVATRRTAVRRVGALGALIGLTATVIIYVTDPVAPSAPDVTLRVVMSVTGDPVDNPVFIRVCGATSGGQPSEIPGSGRLVEVFVDGEIAAEGSTGTFMLHLAPGAHSVAAELVRADHVAFVPRVISPSTALTVAHSGQPASAATIPTCTPGTG